MSSFDTDATAAAATGAADELIRDRLWGALADRDEYAAAATVFAALEAGMTPEDVLLEVIAPVQHRVGAEWAANRISVAQEHAATAINDRVIAALAHHASSKVAAHGGRVVLACVDGEWHALPARLLAEVLRLRGWQVDFLGAQVPTPHLIAHVHEHGPDVVALSCSIPTRLPNAHAAIVACQSAGFPVLAGGAAFGRDGRFARQLGADAWAPDARTAEERLRRGFPSVRRAFSRQPVDDLPHLVDQEYTMVSRSAAQLVKSTLAELEDRFPAMRAYSPLQRQHTVEDIAHIVDFLTVSLYTDDDALFTDFVTWTADILAARGVPAVSLSPALDLLAAQLHEFPRSQRLLRSANDALVASPGAPE